MHHEGSCYWSDTLTQLHRGAFPAWGSAQDGTVSKSVAEADRSHVGFLPRSVRMDASWLPTSIRDFSTKFANPTLRRGNTTLLSIACRPVTAHSRLVLLP